MNPDEKLEVFSRGVDLLGGQRATAKALDVTDRTIRKLLSGEMIVHDGFMKDMAAALHTMMADCRDLIAKIDGPERADG
ncbi:hypothetical protein FHS96_004942 [Sphingomonas zeicaulis]|uniref:hypothetical protein n=1 Tax=Sphingomonas zeicaulis TaxID=1632740 RepID=UPI003D21BDC4